MLATNFAPNNGRHNVHPLFHRIPCKAGWSHKSSSGPGLSHTHPSRAGSHTAPCGTGLSHTPPSGAGDLKYTSKYLIQYVPVPQKKAEAKRVGGARILTSAECFSILEREGEKRIEAEAKAKCKIEREKRKEEREAITKRKAEERAKKAAEVNSRSKNRAPPKVKTSVPKRRKVDKKATSSTEPASGTKQRHTNKMLQQGKSS